MMNIGHREKARDLLGSREINGLNTYCAPYTHTVPGSSEIVCFP